MGERRTKCPQKKSNKSFYIDNHASKFLVDKSIYHLSYHSLQTNTTPTHTNIMPIFKKKPTQEKGSDRSIRYVPSTSLLL